MKINFMALLATIFFLSSISQPSAFAEFENTQDRYVDGMQMLRLLAEKFPVEAEATSQCSNLIEAAAFGGPAEIFGKANLKDGETIFAKPSLQYIEMYIKCADAIVYGILGHKKLTEEYFGSIQEAVIMDGSAANEVDEVELKLATKVVEVMFGPGVFSIQQEKLMTQKILASAKAMQSNEKSFNRNQFLHDLLLAAAISDEFLMASTDANYEVVK